MKLKISALTKKFKATTSLNSITCDITCNCLGIIGKSGSGKSTLLRILAGLHSPTSGSLLINDKSLISKKNTGIVFQSYNLFPHLTAQENIELPLIHVYKESHKQARIHSTELLKRFSLLQHAHKKPYELSGGQAQRIAILRAIVKPKELLLFDEPTSALDPSMTHEVLDLIAELKHEGANLIISSHHLPFLKHITDHNLYLENGNLIEHSPKLFTSPQTTLAKNYIASILKY